MGIFIIIMIILIFFILNKQSKQSDKSKNLEVKISNIQKSLSTLNTYDNKEVDYVESNLKKTINYPDAYEGIFYQFDINKLDFFCSSTVNNGETADLYFISHEYKDKISGYFPMLNILLRDAHKKYPSIPLFQYQYSDLEFERKDIYFNDFCMFCHHPLDYSKNPSQYPYSITLRFGKREHSNIDIFYDVLGNISKASFLCYNGDFHNLDYYTLIARPFDKEFQIVSAYKGQHNKGERIFDIAYELRQERKQEYEWICKFLPQLAPKSFSAYSRIKNAKTEKYLMISELAAQKGKILVEQKTFTK